LTEGKEVDKDSQNKKESEEENKGESKGENKEENNSQQRPEENNSQATPWENPYKNSDLMRNFHIVDFSGVFEEEPTDNSSYRMFLDLDEPYLVKMDEVC
jgi:hypothetical protein